MKQCIKCKQVKLLSDFWKDKRRSDGYRSDCRQCSDAATKKWRANNREAYLKQKRAHRATLDKATLKKEDKHYSLKRKFGISLEDYNLMLTAQNGNCAICGKHHKECSKALAVDHNHKTGKLRSLLCSSCNLMLGYAKDNPAILSKGALYLQDHKEYTNN